MSHTLLGGGNEYGRRAAPGADTVLLDREQGLRPGDTLYLAEGRYTADAAWNAPTDAARRSTSAAADGPPSSSPTHCG